MKPLEPDNPLDELLAGYVLGDLTSEEVARVHELLEIDPEIALEIHRLQTTLALFPLSLPPTSVPQGLRSRLLQAQTLEATAPSSENYRNTRVYRVGLALLGSMVAILIAGLIGENYRLNQRLTATETKLQHLQNQDLPRYQTVIDLLRQPNNRFLSLRGINAKSTVSGSLVIAPQKDTAILVLRNVSPLPKNKVYRLWAFVNGQKVSCAEFTPNPQGEVFLPLPLGEWKETPEVVVTIEPAENSPGPVGEMVITGS